MDNDTVIRVEGLGKRYTLGTQSNERYTALRDVVANSARNLFRRRSPAAPEETKAGDFWALKDVSFEVRRGEVVGIIGRNGAGKSTLLKILSRITEPTQGSIRLRGRVASLLEVGTGFHSELTGRENIFLNGAILGMHRHEIKAKFDEIVAFAEVEKFLDTPVKRYSSGMYVRLAFAVAAHLDPEILIVDEVLAVGDAGFQKKCLGKMQNVSEQGRTVLFVSHQLSTLEHFCKRGIILKQGCIAVDDTIFNATRSYLKSEVDYPSSGQSLEHRTDRKGRGALRFTSVEFIDDRGSIQNTARTGETLRIRLRFRKHSQPDSLRSARFSIAINSNGYVLFVCSSELTDDQEWIIDRDGTAECQIPRLPLSTGDYQITIFAEASGEPQDWIENVMPLQVQGGAFFPSSRQVPLGHEGRYPLVDHRWKRDLCL